MFRDDSDKEYYLNLLKRYCDKYKCCIYAYCLMDSHLHLQLDPKGFDISKYFAFVSHQGDMGSFKELQEKLENAIENEYISGRTVIVRDMTPAKVISYISSRLMIPEKVGLAAKGNKRLQEFRAFSAYVLKYCVDLDTRRSAGKYII